jgi:PAS domain S-box-containing protein
MNCFLPTAFEDSRLETLRKLEILDTSDEKDLDDIVQLIATICDVPIALVSLVDERRQWFKAKVGVAISETPREHAFCAHAILQNELMIVPDALADERFAASPLVTGSMGIRFYAGMPLITTDGYTLGTLCVMGRKPGNLTDFQCLSLRTLARNVIKQIELKYMARQMDERARTLEESNMKLAILNRESRGNLEHIKSLQDQLEIRERQYREMVENATDLIYELNTEGYFSFVNPVMERVSGYTREELFAMRYWELVSPDHRDRIVNFYKEQRRSGKRNTYLEFTMLTKSGEGIWIGQNVNMQFTDDYKVIKVSVISRDITTLKNTELKRMESENRFRTLAENAPVGIFQTDATGVCTYVNKRVSEITGMPEEDMLREGWIKAVYPEDLLRVTTTLQQSVEEKHGFKIELRFVNDTQGIRWVISEGVPVLDDNGVLTGYIGTTHDITERKQMFQKLRDSEELYRLLSSNTRDMIALYKIDASATRTFISPSVNDILGYTSEELVGSSPYDNIHPEDEAQVKKILKSVVFTGNSATLEYRMRRKDGTYVWLESHAHPFYDDNGNMTGFQSSSRDISKRKEFEASLKVAKEKAEEATRAKSLFLSMMSHEIRTPMNAIVGLTNLLLQNDPREDQRERLNLLKFSGHNLLTIINDILDFSKIEAGKLVLESIDINLKKLLSDTRQMLEQRAQEKNISLYMKYDAKLPEFLKGDTVRISQIVTNLLSNAIKFTERGYVELSVKLLGEEKGKYKVQFAVKDTGIGIEADKLETIFEHFTQADNDITRRFGGTGLGLTITKGLLHLMGSKIDLESVPGYGSTFSFVLTMDKGKDEPVAETNSVPGKLVNDETISVLLVEDNRINQIVALNFLQQWGVAVDIANDGFEALTMIKRKSYNMIFMDLQMPGMDGYEASRKIRAMEDPYFKEVPIIALTAAAMSGMRDKVIETGMNDFISKPFDPEELRLKVAKFTLWQQSA